ncbi:MAG TPA: TonB-dependent receptor [Hanamia sp.]|nr:TonB-dependent receptor [Hanamia sp.]
MIQRILYTIFAIALVSHASAQTKQVEDSIPKLLDEIVVTATKTENKVSNIPLPIQVISAKNVQLSGSQKLIDILQMQTGLVIANNPLGTALLGYPNPFGEGIQMQGLDPAYTLILVDGEPLIGRNAGIINLGRIAIGNIKQIEIVRGPATCLYGSDALAGVINIITEEPVKNQLQLQTHYATNNTLSLTGSGNIVHKKIALELFANRYSSDGYDLDKNIYGKTVDPFIDYTANVKLIYNIDHKNKLTLSSRFFRETQFNNYLIYPETLPEIVKGTTEETDGSLFALLQHRVNNKVSYASSVYATSYSNLANAYLQKNDSLYEKIQLTDILVRPEIQVNIGKHLSSLFVTGAGYNYEHINSTRYKDVNDLNSWYLFVQKQIQWKSKTNIIAGARFDKNSLYPAQLSPKIAIAYKFQPRFILKGSVGAGYKAPDFSQQYLNFTNSLVGYTLLGARELGNGLQMLQESGQIDPNININPYLNEKNLSPEKSIGVNAGFDYTLNAHAVVRVNFFRNDISNLIESYNLPFNKTNNQSIFSYMNLDKVFTEGMEASFTYNFNQHFSIFGGYQYLIAKDKEILQKIKNEELYKRDPVTYVTTLVTKSEYKGLYNRSKNNANLLFQYNNILYKATAFITAKFRGSYGYSGLNGFQNGSGVYDDDREMVNGFVLLNLTISKKIGYRWEAQTGIENMLNYINALLMPNIFGRSYFINVNFKFEK